MDLAGLRRDYHGAGLEPGDLDSDPFAQFARWLEDAAGLPEPNAAVLATADANGRPSARHVLLKGADRRGFVFFTNRSSRKGIELEVNPAAALVTAWSPLGRQVCTRGSVEGVSEAEADAYFATRPRGAQLSAWASPQSSVVADRTVLEDARVAAERRFAGGPIPRPPDWGGFRLLPDEIEFWQGRPDRLHDRLRYRREAPEARWRIERLAP